MHVGYTDVPLAPDRPFDVENVRSDGLEILARFSPADSGLVGLSVRRSPGGEEETLITYDFGFDRLEINCGRSSLDLSTERPLTGGPLHRAPDQPLELRLFLDASVIEVFANGRAATARVYPIRSDSLGVRVFSPGCEACRDGQVPRPGRAAVARPLGDRLDLGRHRGYSGRRLTSVDGVEDLCGGLRSGCPRHPRSALHRHFGGC